MTSALHAMSSGGGGALVRRDVVVPAPSIPVRIPPDRMANACMVRRCSWALQRRAKRPSAGDRGCRGARWSRVIPSICIAAVLGVPSARAHPQQGAPSGTTDERAASPQCAASETSCDWMAMVGSLERASLERVLAAHGYVIDPAPWGKVIARIHIHNEEVFAERTRVLRFFNRFHATTRASTIRAELVIQEGELWSQARVDETARRLRDPLWTSVVAIVPLASPRPGHVELLVVTRDVWSLRLNTHYTFSADGEARKLTMLSVTFSENNFLGRRQVLAAAIEMDQGAIAAGPQVIDKNLLGKRIDLRLRGDALFDRAALLDDGRLVREGSASDILLAKPLWSLASTWAVAGSFKHRFEVERVFVGTNLRTYDNPATPEIESVPYVYRQKVITADVNATWQWGTWWKHRLSAGYGIASQRPTPYPLDPAPDAATLEAFVRDVLPRSEVTTGPYVEISSLRPVFKTLRNLQSYDLGEDIRFGPEASLLVGASPRVLGASANSLRATASIGWTFALCRDGFIRGTLGTSLRYEPAATAARSFSRDLIDNTAYARMRVATPSYRAGRLVVESMIQTRWNDTQNRFFTLGSDNGLRGFVIDEFRGERLFATQIEARSVPIELWVLRAGAVVFYELGGAGDSFRELPIHHDVGVGIRWLIPQISRDLFRFDLAIPLDGAAAGTPRLIGGFESAF